MPNSHELQLLIETEQIQELRRQLISFLNELDDILGIERTVPTRRERRLVQKARELELVRDNGHNT